MRCDPYAHVPPAPPLAVTSPDIAAPDGVLPAHCWNRPGANRSPALAWGPLPDGTRSVMVTIFDPDAPVPGGFWHWTVTDLPATTTSLPAGAGAPDDAGLPAGSRQWPNDLGRPGYIGAGPPPGTGTHRYHVAVTALDVDALDLDDRATLAMVNRAAGAHTLARGILVATADAEGPP
ncbi:MAG: YbhB/YbcL family Raf kinase inhibitor-like protein [Actinomycetota bacterium]|nr:YbhB/YbcL family Raf kinase inhibitor-like protein [Actinomycetota bacterium]